MRFVEIMKSKAKEYHNRLVLPEATEARTLRAARTLVDMQIPAELFLVGKKFPTFSTNPINFALFNIF